MPIAVVFLAAAAVIAATGALAATPQEIYRDYADNGRFDREYSPADLERVLKNAAVQQYGQPATGGLPPAVEKEIDDPPPAPPPAAASGGPTASPSGGAAPVQSTGGLPFTGLDLSLIAAGALGLLLLGTALRRVGRQRA